MLPRPLDSTTTILLVFSAAILCFAFFGDAGDVNGDSRHQSVGDELNQETRLNNNSLSPEDKLFLESLLERVLELHNHHCDKH